MQNFDITFDELIENFSFLEDWEERYKYVLDLGKKLAPFPETYKNETYRVKGCVSQVWLHCENENGRLYFSGESDSHLVKGLVAVLCILYSGQTSDVILHIDFKEKFSQMGLSEHLTVQRSNGVFAMVGRIHDYATS